MAKYEKFGYCPSNALLHYEIEKGDKIPEFWKYTKEILKDRHLYMVYTENGCTYKEDCYVVDCLTGSKGTMGIEIASLLKALIPQCEYPKTGRKILVTDVINPYQIPDVISYYDGEEKFKSLNEDMHIFQDERYLCGVIDEGNDVHMYFYKK